MEVLSVQNQYTERFGVLGGTTKPKDWSRPLQSRKDDSSTSTSSSNNNNNNNRNNRNINQAILTTGDNINYSDESNDGKYANLYNDGADIDYDYIDDDNFEELTYCDNIDANAVNELSLRLLDELRAAKSRNLTCTEVSIPCDLTTRIASEIMRVSEREPCGIRGCTIYIDFETEPQNTRRIGILKVAPEMVSTFELYLTLRQDKRGWTSLLPQFMKNLSRSITISPKFSLIKHKLYTDGSS